MTRRHESQYNSPGLVLTPLSPFAAHLLHFPVSSLQKFSNKGEKKPQNDLETQGSVLYFPSCHGDDDGVFSTTPTHVTLCEQSYSRLS